MHPPRTRDTPDPAADAARPRTRAARAPGVAVAVLRSPCRRYCASPLRSIGPVIVVVVLFALVAIRSAAATPRWELEARLGGAWSAALPIHIHQDGYADLSITPRWRERALESPLYYGWRVARWRDGGGWALDLTHHKLYLDDPPPEVREFSISHGYNLLTLQRLAERDGWRYGAGLGVVVAHPESEVRGARFDEGGGMFHGGYYLGGPTAAVLLGRSGRVHGGLRAMAEARLTFSYARVPIAGGDARVPDVALHATVGLAWSSAP